MKTLTRLFLLTLICSCNSQPSPQFEDGWHKAFIEIINKKSEAAMVYTKDDLVDSVCFSSGRCVGHFTMWTTYEHSQDVSGKESDDIYTVYIIPDEWDQAKELFQKKEELPSYQ